MASDRYQGWVSVFRSGTDYEAELVRDRLVDSGIAAVVLAHRDHAFNLTHGDMAQVRVMVHPDHVHAALGLLASEPLTMEELTRVALAADPDAPHQDDPGDESADEDEGGR